MSNFLAIATVTATLSQLIRTAAVRDVPAANVTTLRPDKLSGGAVPGPGVNLFLYQVTANGGLRNERLPARDERGRLVQQPRAALSLHFLISCYGDDSQLEPQRLLGTVARTLETRPVLTRGMIRATITDPAYGYLAASDLADDSELVKFSPIPLSLEDLSKLWSVFFQTPYVLSTAYEASVVLVESLDVARASLPVRDRKVYVVPFEQPIIERTVPSIGEDDSFVWGDVLVVFGRHLKGESTKVRIRGVDTKPDEVAEERVSIRLAEPPIKTSVLRAGLMAVQVIHERMMGSPETLHAGYESNVAAVTLRPSLVGAPQPSNIADDGHGRRSGDVLVKLRPIVGREQRVNLLLTEFGSTDPVSYSFPATNRSGDIDSVGFPISHVKPGSYLLRVQVDGATSRLGLDTVVGSPTENEYTSPRVDI